MKNIETNRYVHFTLNIPSGETNWQSLDYCLEVESFQNKAKAESQRCNYSENIERLQREGWNRNLFPYERWDLIFRGIYQKEKGLEKLALDLLQNDGWYGMDMMMRADQKTGKEEFVFRMADGCSFSYTPIFTEDTSVSFGELAERNPNLFRFIYGRSVEEIRAHTQKHMRKQKSILARGGPLSEFLGGRETIFYGGTQNVWRHGMHGSMYNTPDRFNIGDTTRSISRGVKYVK